METSRKQFILLLVTVTILADRTVEGALLRRDPNVDKSATLWLIHYERNWTAEEVSDSGAFVKDTENMQRDLEKPGYSFRDYCSIDPASGLQSQYSWEYGTWNAGQNYGMAQSGLYVGDGACGRRDDPSTYQFPVPPAVQSQCDGGSFRILTDQWGDSYYQTVNRHEKSIWQLHTGSKGYPGRPNLFEFFLTATGYSDLFFPEVDADTGRYPIDPAAIKVGELGYPSSDGWLCRALGNNQTLDATPQVRSSRYYGYTISFGKYLLLSTVACVARDNPNLDRTTIGVGENVRVEFDATPLLGPTWTTTAGSLSSSGNGVILTAPDSGTNATVTAHVRDAQIAVAFDVVQPTGVSATIRGTDNNFNVGVSGAGMQLDVVLQPTTVSFGRVYMEEIGENASGVSGYYVYHPPGGHTTGRGANTPHPVGCDNLIGDEMDHASWFGDPQPWVVLGQYNGGSFTWPIPAVWWVPPGPAHNLPWSDQSFALAPDGTMTVSKFGHSVTRTIQGVITTQ
jgi:hypothetical protein